MKPKTPAQRKWYAAGLKTAERKASRYACTSSGAFCYCYACTTVQRIAAARRAVEKEGKRG